MDRFTIRNLELLSQNDSSSLFKTINHTVSPMGARLLRRWLLMPQKNIKSINERLEVVETFIKDTEVRTQLSQFIKQAGDVERLAAKVPLKKITPRELLQVAKGLQQTALIKTICVASDNAYLKRLGDSLNPCSFILEKILKQMHPNPPASIGKGSVIADGVNDDLDELRAIATGGKNYLNELQQKEAAATGISSLKISFNNVFGYYLEVTNLHKNKVPETWIRKQTLANAERYIAPMQVNGHVMAVLDCLACFAQNAIQFQYKKPTLHDGDELRLSDSRHPVIERNLPAGEAYISNDVLLDANNQQIIILTGPNMSGKSAILRQTALITLMAHMGSFVPASKALIPLTDKIFTRVGASDNLSGGESTFMVEMNETASIINNLTARSLILLDEIGRGTSTYDGISIAWSIAEYLHQSPFTPKTLFATHYHELNELENKFERIKNFHITNKEVGNKIIFLRKLAEGGSIHSFGIHVARMAGMPPKLIDRANEILAQLEEKNMANDVADLKNGSRSISEKVKDIGLPKMQLNIFDVHSVTFEEIRSLLEKVDINRLTPVEALLKLQEIKQVLK